MLSVSIRELIIQILIIVIQITFIILVPIILRAIQKYVNHLEVQIGKANYEKYSLIIKDIVYAVEQQYPDLAGEEKYKTAVYAINEKLGGILSDKEMSDLIEAAVASINLITKGTTRKSIINDGSIKKPLNQ